MSGNWKIFIDSQPWNGSRRLFMALADRAGRSYVQPLTTQRAEVGTVYDVPTLSETVEDQEDGVGDVTGFLQATLDAAWELGMRPLAYADHTNELKAVRYHLEDMRALAKVGGTTDGH